MLGKVRILIIEEHPAVSEALVARLSKASTLEIIGHASSFEKGLEQIRSRQPDVVILETKGRSQHGLDPIGAISRALSGRPVGIIILTSYQDDIERAMVLQAGAQRYILKDIDSAHLIKEIETVAELVHERPATGDQSGKVAGLSTNGDQPSTIG